MSAKRARLANCTKATFVLAPSILIVTMNRAVNHLHRIRLAARAPEQPATVIATVTVTGAIVIHHLGTILHHRSDRATTVKAMVEPAAEVVTAQVIVAIVSPMTETAAAMMVRLAGSTCQCRVPLQVLDRHPVETIS